eukprot:g12229.t1
MDGARGARWWQVSELLGAMRQKQVHCTEVSINVAMAVLSQAGCWDKALRLSLQAFGFDAIRTRESLAACEKALCFPLCWFDDASFKLSRQVPGPWHFAC